MEVVLGVVGSLLLLLVPGLPVAAVLAGRASNWWEVLALSPVLSLGMTLALLQGVNRLGIAPNMAAFAATLLVASAGAMLFLLLTSRYRADIRDLRMMAALLAPAALALMLWSAAYQGFDFVAPNQDAYNHNLWISRIMDQGSSLSADVRVQSPLQDHAEAEANGSQFYPTAWHAGVASMASLFHVPAPTMSILSTVVFWCVGLPAGLIALARRITIEHGVLTGILAGVISQTIPLVPGVPMSWGAMPSVVGVALLPAGFLSVVAFFECPGVRSAALLALMGLSLFVIHSPEAATLLVLTLVSAAVLASRGKLNRPTTLALAGLTASSAMVAVSFAGPIRRLADAIRSHLGGNERSINESLGSYLTLSINVPDTQLVFGLLVLSGVWIASKMARGPWLAIAVSSTLAVYLVAGSNTEPLVSLRPLTVPWYGSYERTAWVAVPFLALLAALPLSYLTVHVSRRGLVGALSVCLASILLAAQGWQGATATLEELRTGVAENQLTGPGSRRVFQDAATLAADRRIILSGPGDGSAYAYMYDRVPVTNGPYDREGRPNEHLRVLLAGLRDLCSIPRAQQILEREGVSGFLLGTRQFAWSPPAWTETEIEHLTGVDLVSRNEDLFLLMPALNECR